MFLSHEYMKNHGKTTTVSFTQQAEAQLAQIAKDNFKGFTELLAVLPEVAENPLSPYGIKIPEGYEPTVIPRLTPYFDQRIEDWGSWSSTAVAGCVDFDLEISDIVAECYATTLSGATGEQFIKALREGLFLTNVTYDQKYQFYLTGARNIILRAQSVIVSPQECSQ